MNYALIIRPLIGAGIGYITNWIAVKMMFRPLNEKRIGKIKIPFTPGIIPRNKVRLAESVGNAINENLLTEDTLRETLLSDELKTELKEKISNYIDSLTENNTTVKDFICLYIDDEKLENNLELIKNNIANSIYETVLEANLGSIVAQQIELSAKEKLKSSILGMLGGNAIISSISEGAELKVNDYIQKNGKKLILDMVNSEISKYEGKKLSDVKRDIQTNNIDLTHFLMNAYENFILNKLSDILLTINIPKIVKDKINSMDTLELEKILLEIMKKELNALVNLGAIIGFILGLLNLLF